MLRMYAEFEKLPLPATTSKLARAGRRVEIWKKIQRRNDHH